MLNILNIGNFIFYRSWIPKIAPRSSHAPTKELAWLNPTYYGGGGGGAQCAPPPPVGFSIGVF